MLKSVGKNRHRSSEDINKFLMKSSIRNLSGSKMIHRPLS